MHITVLDLVIFCIAYSLLKGVWQFFYLRINKRGYEVNKLEGESYYDFMCRYYSWGIRKKLHLGRFYNSKFYVKFTIFKGVFLILFALVLLLLVFLISRSEFALWLKLEV